MKRVGKVCVKHPQLVGARNSSYTCVGCATENTARWRANNVDKMRLSDKLRKERTFDVRREAYKSWRGRNADKMRASNRAWRVANCSVVIARKAQRRADKIKATPKWANYFFISEIYSLAKLREKVCGGLWHVDHIVPIRSALVCGLHAEHNLQVIRAEKNLSKSNRYWPDMPGESCAIELNNAREWAKALK